MKWTLMCQGRQHKTPSALSHGPSPGNLLRGRMPVWDPKPTPLEAAILCARADADPTNFEHWAYLSLGEVTVRYFFRPSELLKG